MNEKNVLAIVDLHNFEKLEQSDIENMIYEYYRKTIEGLERDLIIEIEIKHHPEEEDRFKFYLYTGTVSTAQKILLDISSAFDFNMLLGILSK